LNNGPHHRGRPLLLESQKNTDGHRPRPSGRRPSGSRDVQSVRSYAPHQSRTLGRLISY
jgi:hypothetical protein